tara:strand:+ start:18367 stop:19518 length:1152 start_codon:yes stop_codon:yes gene_type:complete
MISSALQAQLSLSAIPIATVNNNFRSLALGNAVVSLSGKYGDYHINPAGVGLTNSIQVYGGRDYPDGYGSGRTFLILNYGFKKSGFNLSLQKYQWEEQLTLVGSYKKLRGRFNSDEIFMNASYSYSFNPYLRAGIGINYIHTTQSSGSIYSQALTDDLKFFTVDLGFLYQGSSYKISMGSITPNAGFSISDFGKSQSYYSSGYGEPLPTTLRLGAGLTFESDKKVWNQHLIGSSVLFNTSKFTGRKELKGNEMDGYYYEAMPAFKALFNSWGTFEWNNGQQIKNYSLPEQIWLHSGIELTFLETFSLRFGRENAANEEEWLSYRSVGFGVDLYYISLDYTSIKLDSGEPNLYYNFYSGNHWQLTGRFPLKGKKPNTILTQILK